MTLLEGIQSNGGALAVKDPATGAVIAQARANDGEEISHAIQLADTARHAWAARALSKEN